MSNSPRSKSFSVNASQGIQALQVKPPQFAAEARVVLPGSEKAAPSNALHLKATPPKSSVTVSVIVKRKEELKINRRGGRAAGPVRLTRAEYKKHHSSDPDAVKRVKAFAKEYKLKVESDPTSALRRTIQLTGTAADMQKAFGVELNQKTIDGTEYRVREGGIHIPTSLEGVVEAVLGLDTGPRHSRTFVSISQAQPLEPRLPATRPRK